MSSEETKRSATPKDQTLQPPRPRKRPGASRNSIDDKDRPASAKRQRNSEVGTKFNQSPVEGSSTKEDQTNSRREREEREPASQGFPSQGVKRSYPADDNLNDSPRPRKRPGAFHDSTHNNDAPTAAKWQRNSEADAKSNSFPREHQTKISTELHKPPRPSTVNNQALPQSRREREESKFTVQGSPQGLKRSYPADESLNEPPRPRKRPGGAARISSAEKEAVLKRQQEREADARKEAESRGVHDVVRQHYNAVPQRGRDWRMTDSQIKGLRSFNNWVKSVIIHRFSPTDGGNGAPLRVLDLGCGKGGDLGKWQQAPQPVEILVGIDPAEVSIDQARDRHAQMQRGGNRAGRGGQGGGRRQRAFEAVFIAQDAFGKSIASIPIVRHIGFDPSAPAQRRGGGGFDVVSMMFCMHYAFESEAKTRQMLQNVAGSLHKGGRFIGTIPNSDAIRLRVETFHKTQQEIHELKEADRSKPSLVSGTGAADLTAQGVVQKEPKSQISSANGEPTGIDVEVELSTKTASVREISNKSSPINPENGQAPVQTESLKSITLKCSVQHPAANRTEWGDLQVAEWGNSIYRVRFPGPTPKDGVFRPPFGWKYSFFLEEAVEEIPEYVVPWEAFRA